MMLTLLTVTFIRPFLKMNPLAMYSYSNLHNRHVEKSLFQGFARTCSQARWGTQQRCCCKQCRSSFSPLCSFGSSLAVPHIWVVEVVRVNISLIWKSPQLPGNPGIWVQAVTNPQCQGNRACPSDAENHLFFLKLFLTSINIVAKPSESMIQVFHMRVQNWALKYGSRELNTWKSI